MTPALVTADNEVFTERTSGRLRDRVDDEGTLFYVRWDVPQVGGNEGEARLEGPHADFFVPHHITPGGNHNVQEPHRESDWRHCRHCQSLRFDGWESKGRCLMHTGHEAVPLSPTYQLPFNLPDPISARVFHDSSNGSWSAQGAWPFCRRCYGLFYGPHNADGDCQAGDVHREYPGYNDQSRYTLS
jgi:hypothetical protein